MIPLDYSTVRAQLCSTAQHSTVLYPGTVLYCTVYCTVLYCTVKIPRHASQAYRIKIHKYAKTTRILMKL